MINALHPLSKVLIALILTVLLFIYDNPRETMAQLVFLVALFGLARVSLLALWSVVKPLSWVLALSLILNTYFGGGPTLISVGSFAIGSTGLYNGLTILYKTLFLLAVAVLLNATTPPRDLTEATSLLLRPLKKVGLPVTEIAMMTTMALRFIPALNEEANRIFIATKARGLKGQEIWWKRIFYLVLIFVPLLASIFRRSENLALAMEARGFRVERVRTRMKLISAGWPDVAAFLVVLILVVILWLL